MGLRNITTSLGRRFRCPSGGKREGNVHLSLSLPPSALFRSSFLASRPADLSSPGANDRPNYCPYETLQFPTWIQSRRLIRRFNPPWNPSSTSPPSPTPRPRTPPRLPSTPTPPDHWARRSPIANSSVSSVTSPTAGAEFGQPFLPPLQRRPSVRRRRMAKARRSRHHCQPSKQHWLLSRLCLLPHLSRHCPSTPPPSSPSHPPWPFRPSRPPPHLRPSSPTPSSPQLTNRPRRRIHSSPSSPRCRRLQPSPTSSETSIPTSNSTRRRSCKPGVQTSIPFFDCQMQI